MTNSMSTVIIGNGVAGYGCALRLAKAGAQVTLIGPGEVVDRPPLTKAALSDGELRLLADAQRLAGQGIIQVDGLASAIDLSNRSVTVERPSGSETHQADNLVVATGLCYDSPMLGDLPGSFVNATPDGMLQLAERLRVGASRVLVVGAGLIGSETAATVSRCGHRVTLIDVALEPVARLPGPLRVFFAAALGAAGVRFLGGVTVIGHEAVGASTLVQTAEHGELIADVVILATGGRPMDLPGLSLAPGQQTLTPPIAVDHAMRVPGFEHVYAIGDLASPIHARFGRLRHPHWDTAMRTGEVAATRILGTEAVFDSVPYWWSDIGEHSVATYGITDLVVHWQQDTELHVGTDADGVVVCAMVMDQRRRQREARGLVAAAE